MRMIPLLFIFLLGCSHSSKTNDTNHSSQPNWIKSSNAIAEQFSKDVAQIFPETGSEIGFTEFDSKGLLFDSQVEDKTRQLFSEWSQKLSYQMQTTTDIELKTDLKVLQDWLLTQISLIDVSRNEHEIEFNAATKKIYGHLQVLINSQSTKERKKASVDRFKIYVNGDSTHQPLLSALEQNFKNLQKKYQSKKVLLPYQGEVEQYLKDSNAYLTGIEEMLQMTDRNDWQNDLDLFKKQVSQYDNFVKTEILPISRKNPRLPLAIYTQILKRRQIQSTPTQLIEKGLHDYKKVYSEFKAQARIVADLRKLTHAHPAYVINALKKESVTNPKEVEKLYQNSIQRLEEMIRQHELVSLPSKPLQIRIAGEAESRAVPVPHLTQPPFINNKGERPEFVVPSSNNGMEIDDFLSIHSGMILTAHEGRPGHDLQFSSILDSGTSLIRGMYAANNVNIEGWALYAEDLVFPYLTPEEKLLALQTRLWRIARMFLDPQIQLGKIPDQKVIDVFVKELGVSKVMAGLELNRYKFSDIGQAPSYYEGYLLVKKMRDEQQQKLGSKFNLKCFNDRLLSYGLLPLTISAERMRNEFGCGK